MIAQNFADIIIFRGYKRQRGRGFGAPVQTFGTTAIPFTKKYIVQAANRFGADLFEIAIPKIGEIDNGRKKTQNFCKRCGNKNNSETIGMWKKI